MSDYPRTVLEFRDWFASEQACHDYLVRLRWPEGPRCSRCPAAKVWPMKPPFFRCRWLAIVVVLVLDSGEFDDEDEDEDENDALLPLERSSA